MATKRLAPRRELSPTQLTTLRAALLEQRTFRRPIALSRLRICPQCLYCGECHRLQETDQ